MAKITVTILLMLSLGAPAYAQAPASEEEALAEALEALRQLELSSAAPEAVAAAQAEACSLLPHPTARTICTAVVGLVTFGLSVSEVVSLMEQDAEEMNQDREDLIRRLDDLESWRGATDTRLSEMDGKLGEMDTRLSEMDGKLDLLIELLRGADE